MSSNHEPTPFPELNWPWLCVDNGCTSMLNTCAVGRVTSKRAALAWALSDVEPLPGSVAETLEFHRYVRGRVDAS